MLWFKVRHLGVRLTRGGCDELVITHRFSSGVSTLVDLMRAQAVQLAGSRALTKMSRPTVVAYLPKTQSSANYRPRT